jgi:hypothetical protein
MVELYLHSPILIHGVVLDYLSTGTALPMGSVLYQRKRLVLRCSFYVIKVIELWFAPKFSPDILDTLQDLNRELFIVYTNFADSAVIRRSGMPKSVTSFEFTEECRRLPGNWEGNKNQSVMKLSDLDQGCDHSFCKFT